MRGTSDIDLIVPAHLRRALLKGKLEHAPPGFADVGGACFSLPSRFLAVCHAPLGPPRITSAGQPSAMSLKFWMKRAASVAYFWRYASRFGHVAAGSRICAGTPSHSVGTWNPNTGSSRKFAPCSFPERAA